MTKNDIIYGLEHGSNACVRCNRTFERGEYVRVAGVDISSGRDVYEHVVDCERDGETTS